MSQPNPKFPGTVAVPTDGGPVRYEYPGGGSWNIDPDDPYFHQTEDGSFRVPEDSSYHTGGADAEVRITEQKLDPGIVKIELDLDEDFMLTEVHFLVRVRNGSGPEAKFFLRGIDPDEYSKAPHWVLTPYA